MDFSDRLLDENRDTWEAMQFHRFVSDVLSDRLPPDVFARYLIYEGAFVETAMKIFALALAKALTLQQRIWLSDVIHALAHDQVSYFEARYAALEIRQSDFVPFPDSVAAFDDGMLQIARDGEYADIVVAMLAAEWMYATWCGRVQLATISDSDLRRWVALHTEPGFLEQVARLKAETNLLGQIVPSEEHNRLSGVFRKVLNLEIAFHSAPYG